MTLEFEVPSYDDAGSEQRIYAKILAEILCACAEHIRPYEVVEDEKVAMRKLSDAYIHWAHALKRNGEYNEAIEKYYKSYTLNLQCGDASAVDARLTKFIEKLKNNEFSDPTALLSEYILFSPTDGTRLWLQMCAAYRHEQYEGDDSSDPIDTAINACSKALGNATEFSPTLRVACHYAMLRIYRDLRYPDDTGKTFIEQIAKDGDYKTRQDHLTVFDQRLLSQWIRDFINEYNERCDDEEIPSTLADEFFLPTLEDAMVELNDRSLCLGDTLILINDYPGAVAYWEWILSECETFYSTSVKCLIYDEETTIEQVFNELQRLQENANEYMLRLVTSHEQLSRYYIQASERPGVSASDAVDYLEEATLQCQAAIKLRAQMARDGKPGTVDLQRLLKEIEKQLTEATVKVEQEGEENDNDSDDYESDMENENNDAD
ncbi:unnamed protein product [Rotaria sp. Silwood2]|nr:unnamed protein product [Rotaria sp. Silwood2]CAF3989045.1 unnamed protein product [Rotaria sp. Silwood2]